MADPFDILTYNGTTLSTGNIEAWLDQRDPYVISASLETRARRNDAPLVDGYTLDGTQRFIRVAQRGSAVSVDEFRTEVESLFDPSGNGTARALTFLAGDGTTQLRLGTYIVRREWIPVGVDQYIIELFAPAGGSEAVTATTSAANPATVTNSGTRPVKPTITLTTATHVTRRPTTIADTSGRGLIAYPVRAALSTVSATTANTFVYINGVSVPTYVEDSGLVTSAVWFLADVPADGSNLEVDIVYGPGLTNVLSGTLPAGGMDFDASSNTSWVWNDWSASDHPSRPGVWHLGTFGRHTSGTSYEINAESSTALKFEVSGGTTLVSDADGVVLAVGSQAGVTGALTGVTRTTTRTAGTCTSRVDYRQANSGRWINAWEAQSTNTTVSTSIDLDNAVEIRAYIEAGAAASGCTLELSGTATLALINTPTVTVGAAENLDHYDGTYVIGDYTITFDDLIVTDGTLTIDCAAKSITTSVDGPQYGDDTPSFSDQDQWVLIEPGSNTVTDGLSVTDTIAFRAGHA